MTAWMAQDFNFFCAALGVNSSLHSLTAAMV
jgi:hypothetical protein